MTSNTQTINKYRHIFNNGYCMHPYNRPDEALTTAQIKALLLIIKEGGCYMDFFSGNFYTDISRTNIRSNTFFAICHYLQPYSMQHSLNSHYDLTGLLYDLKELYNIF